jgi:hypothetical protein
LRGGDERVVEVVPEMLAGKTCWLLFREEEEKVVEVAQGMPDVAT